MTLHDCNPTLRRRIAEQIAHDLAAEQARRAAALTQAENQDAVAMPPDADQCCCDLCLDRHELEAASMITPPENTKESLSRPVEAGDKARSTQTSRSTLKLYLP